MYFVRFVSQELAAARKSTEEAIARDAAVAESEREKKVPTSGGLARSKWFCVCLCDRFWCLKVPV